MSEVTQKTSSRILTFDIMRGYFLSVILLNHLQYYPSPLAFFTGQGLLYASTAEGFFAVSGIVLGIIRGRKLIEAPFKKAASLLLKRSFQLYITSIVLTLLFTFIGSFFIGSVGLKYGIFTDWNNFGDLLWKTLALQYTYGWADFLRYYALFLFFAPAALWLLRKGYWYVVVAISLFVWCLFPLSPLPPEMSQPLSWQLIFFGSFIIGYYWPQLVEYWQTLSFKMRKAIGFSLISTAILTIIASTLLVFHAELGGVFASQLQSIHHSIELAFNKDRLPITRIFIGAIWFWAFFWVLRKYEGVIVKKVGRFFLPLGENSLYVYTIQAFIVFFAHLFILHPKGSENIFINMALSLSALGLVWVAVRTKFLMKIIPR
ncbi:MAG: hypothetical protein JWO54_338 [Candidatus Saccharibacteria bacterium]|nr:hypothetical protein [Candidatus Saccharibacteria bacterium]